MLIALFVILYGSGVLDVMDACRYPDFVQSRGGERDWRGHQLSQAAGGQPTQCSMSFDGRLMRVVASNVAFQRRCMLKVGNRTYLAAQRDMAVTTDRAPPNRYLCMDFIRRSDAVLQLRTSRLASRMDPHLCAENQLIIDDRPVVDRRKLSVGSSCQLFGGYDVHLYDRRLRRGVCDALDAETRLEAACAGDDSLVHFRFRYDFCVPSALSMRVDQLTRCAATWTTDTDVFTVLVASSADDEDRLDAWCLRRPRRTFGRPFIAFLFSELVCEPRPAAELADALVVDMQQSEDWKSSLCRDDYEGCAWDYPNKCTSRTPDCARTCSLCNDSSPKNCFFRAPIYGRWQSPDGTTSLTVNSSSLLLRRVDHSGSTRSTTFECVEWLRGSRSSNVSNFVDHDVDEHLVVTRPGSGCRPRYACVQFQYHIADDGGQAPSVIHFRISASRPWPIYNRLDCSSFPFVSLQSSSRNVEQHFALLTDVTHGRNHVNCVTTSLPVATRYVVEFLDEHRRCFANIELLPNPADIDRYFRLSLDGCWEKNIALDVWCLDRVMLSSKSNVLLVTESVPTFPNFDADSVICWLFTVNDTFYLLSSADCDPHMSLERLQDRIIHPIAIFVNELTVTSTTFTATATPSILSSPFFVEYNYTTDYGPSDNVTTLYDVAPDVTNSATTAPTPRRQSPNEIRHDSAAQQSPVVDAMDQSDVGSRGHGDRSAVSHATTGAAAPVAVIIVDVFILLAVAATIFRDLSLSVFGAESYE